MPWHLILVTIYCNKGSTIPSQILSNKLKSNTVPIAQSGCYGLNIGKRKIFFLISGMNKCCAGSKKSLCSLASFINLGTHIVYSIYFPIFIFLQIHIIIAKENLAERRNNTRSFQQSLGILTRIPAGTDKHIDYIAQQLCCRPYFLWCSNIDFVQGSNIGIFIYTQFPGCGSKLGFIRFFR